LFYFLLELPACRTTNLSCPCTTYKENIFYKKTLWAAFQFYTTSASLPAPPFFSPACVAFRPVASPFYVPRREPGRRISPTSQPRRLASIPGIFRLDRRTVKKKKTGILPTFRHRAEGRTRRHTTAFILPNRRRRSSSIYQQTRTRVCDCAVTHRRAATFCTAGADLTYVLRLSRRIPFRTCRLHPAPTATRLSQCSIGRLWPCDRRWDLPTCPPPCLPTTTVTTTCLRHTHHHTPPGGRASHTHTPTSGGLPPAVTPGRQERVGSTRALTSRSSDRPPRCAPAYLIPPLSYSAGQHLRRLAALPAISIPHLELTPYGRLPAFVLVRSRPQLTTNLPYCLQPHTLRLHRYLSYLPLPWTRHPHTLPTIP